MAKKTQAYMALRRQAQDGRPLVRQSGGSWLGFGIRWCCEESGLSNGQLVAMLAQRMGMKPDQIYRVIRGHGGMPPDVLWRGGLELRKLGVWWMSGPLALALEPRYEAHLLGVVGELVQDPKHFLWRGSLYDFLQHRYDFCERSEFGLRSIKAAGDLPLELQILFEAAWQRWYAFDASELKTKEHESRFADDAPALARAVSLLRAQQRHGDSDSYERSYGLLLHDVNKDIREYFQVGGIKPYPSQSRQRYPVDGFPRYNLLSNDVFGLTNFGQSLQELIAPGGERLPPSEAFRNAWDLRVEGFSGLLALALLDYQREYYLLIASVIMRGIKQNGKPLMPMLRRFDEQIETADDIKELQHYKTWWRALWMISCLIGPSKMKMSFEVKDLGKLLAKKFVGVLRTQVNASSADLHRLLFTDSHLADELRKKMALPDDIAESLSRFSVSSRYDRSDYESSFMPTKLATVLDMLHSSDVGYPPDHARIELSSWFRNLSRKLDYIDLVNRIPQARIRRERRDDVSR